MNTIIRWNPFREMDDLQRRMASLLELGATPRPTGPKEEEALTVPQWTPLVDIVEDEKEYLIKAELPEVRREDVRVTVQEGTLNLTGERKVEKEEKGRRLHRVERFYGRFERSFTLPEDADAESVKAEFKDGVLRVHVAKSEKAQPKQIDIKVS